MRDLEARLGAQLFERTNGGTRTTVAGLEFLQAASHIVEEAEAAIRNLRTRDRGENGHLTIGVHASFSAGNLRATLIEFSRKLPDIRISLVDGSSDHLVSDLRGSTIDIAFVAEELPRWDDRMLPVWSERVVVALPEDHPLSGAASISWLELTGERILVPRRGLGREFERLLLRALGTENAYTLTRQDVALDRLLTLVGAKQGVLLVLEGATGLSYPGVVYRELHDREGLSRLDFRAYWRGTNNNPALRPLIETLQDRYPDLSVDPHGS